jgi:DNA-binding SARP family transcriptional activator
LRGKFIHALSMHGAELESKGDLASALACYQRGIDADPVVESFHIGLMRCYLALDKPTEAVSAFRRLRHTLSVLLGVPPSPEAQRLFDNILELRAGQGGAAEHGSPDDGDAGRSTLQSAGNVTNLHVNSSRRR